MLLRSYLKSRDLLEKIPNKMEIPLKVAFCGKSSWSGNKAAEECDSFIRYFIWLLCEKSIHLFQWNWFVFLWDRLKLSNLLKNRGVSLSLETWRSFEILVSIVGTYWFGQSFEMLDSSQQKMQSPMTHLSQWVQSGLENGLISFKNLYKIIILNLSVFKICVE